MKIDKYKKFLEKEIERLDKFTKNDYCDGKKAGYKSALEQYNLRTKK